MERDRAGLVGAEQGGIVRLAAWLVVAAIIVAALYVGQAVLIPLAIAFLISFALNPLVTWLTRHGLPRMAAVIAVMLTAGLLLVALGFLVTSQVRALSAQLPVYQSTIRGKISDIGASLRAPGVFDGALKTVDTVKKEVAANVAPEHVPPAQRVEIAEPPDGPIRTAIEWVAPALSPLATAGIVLVFVFLALLDRGDLRDRLIGLLGGSLHRATDAMEDAGKRISKYLLMQLVVNVLYGIPMALGLWLIGVPGWLLWGALAGLMRFIPYVGPLLAAIFPLALAFAVDPGWQMVLWTVALIVALEVLSNNIVEPLLYGSSTGLSGMSLIAAATFWTTLWGPAGLILSTPLTVCLLVVGRNHPQLQFLDTLLGSTPALDVPTRIYQRLLADDPEEAIEIVDEVIDEQPVTDFYNDYGIEVLRRLSDDYLSSARAGHRLRVANGMDMLLEDLRESHPPALAAGQAARVACIGGKWEIDRVACEMLAHALELEGVAATVRPEGTLTPRYLDKLELEGIEVICLSYFSRDPEASARAFCRRLSHRWPQRRIVLALWNAPEPLLDADKVGALGADEAVTSVREAVGRIHRLVAPQAPRLQPAPVPENEAERVAALRASGVLDGHVREALDDLARRAAGVFDVGFALITAVDEAHEFVIGQSVELPGTPIPGDSAMITFARDAALSGHVIASGETVVVNDTERDPRFVDHPVIGAWKARFLAAAPLKQGGGLVVGALCLFDGAPRPFDDEERELLDGMAADAVSIMTGEEAEVPASRPDAAPSATVGQQVPE